MTDTKRQEQRAAFEARLEAKRQEKTERIESALRLHGERLTAVAFPDGSYWNHEKPDELTIEFMEGET